MGNRYRRVVTLGMISFTALLAWVYCMVVYRSKLLYVAVVSVALVVSIYALLLAVVDIKVEKEASMREYILNMVKDSLAKQDYTDALETLERLAKASYVQQRKVNTFLDRQTETVTEAIGEHGKNQETVVANLQAQIAETLTKTAKILIKYNQNNSEKQFEATKDQTKEMTAELAELSTTVSQITNLLDQMTTEIGSVKDAVEEIKVLPQASVDKTWMDEATAPDMESVDVESHTDESVLPVEEFAGQDGEQIVSEQYPEQDGEQIVSEEHPEQDGEQPVSEELPEQGGEQPASEELPEQSSMQMTADQLAGLDHEQVETVQEVRDASFNSEAEVIPFPQTEETEIQADEAQEMEQVEDVADIQEFAADKETVDDTDEMVDVDGDTADMGVDTINADVNIVDAVDLSAEGEPTVGASEEKEAVEEPVVTPLDGDPNRQLTPEEIAALFASVQ